MKIYRTEERNVEDLIPYAMNARTHSDEQVAQIAASIREFGFTTRLRFFRPTSFVVHRKKRPSRDDGTKGKIKWQCVK